MVTAAYGHLQPQTIHRFLAGLSGKDRISDGREINGMKTRRGRERGPPKLSLTGRKATAEAASSRPYSVEMCGRNNAGGLASSGEVVVTQEL
ncbi:hypothetical protein EVAR_47976_1 [Eumeta japonica]|uniref:Uncharacterized protein n=1 Tax=Eumeta variegata TaxID=151549 RepID=A0A4C1XJN5_EUMVA|nr:hypothetical protein EVAR_47976_1 [Eumeta japonica]